MTPAWRQFLDELSRAAEALPDVRPVMVLGLPPAGTTPKPTMIWWGPIPDDVRRKLLQRLGLGTLGPRQRIVDGAIVDVIQTDVS